MAIYHLTVKHVSRGKGGKAVASAAYRSGEKLADQRYEVTHDYTRRRGVIHTEIMTPEPWPAWAKDREKLWNQVEQTEKRKDAQLAMEVEVALPRELDREQQVKLVRGFVEDQFVRRGMIADIGIHEMPAAGGEENPHAHILLTTRPVTETGFAGNKPREWAAKETLLLYREAWADHCNLALAEAGATERVDHRTLEAQGILREPTTHLGRESAGIERRGDESERARDQLSAVDRELNPYKEQIHQRGMVDLHSAAEPSASWWDRTVEFVQQTGSRVREWMDTARQGWRQWTQGGTGNEPESGPMRTR